MKKCFKYILLLTFISSCTNHYNKNIDVTHVIPKSHHTILKINAIKEFKSLSNDASFIKEFQIDSILKPFAYLNTTNPFYISNSDNTSLLITKFSESLTLNDSTTNISSKRIDDSDIYKTINNKDTIYNIFKGNLYIASTHKQLIQNLEIKENKYLKKLLSTTDYKSIASVVFKNNRNTDILLSTNKTSAASYEVIDLKSEQNAISFNGVSKSKDSLSQFSAFNSTKPQAFELSKIIPENTESIERIAFDDYTVFLENLSLINPFKSNETNTFINYANEIALIKTKKGSAVALSTIDIDLMKDALVSNTNFETFKGINIFSFKNKNIFDNSLKPFIEFKNAEFGFVLENFIVFSNNVVTLKDIITNKLNNQSLANSEKFKSASQNLADDSSYLVYKDGIGLKYLLNKSIKGYNTNIVQYVHDTDFTHINGVFSEYSKTNNTDKISENFTLKLPAEILRQPQTVKNHRNGNYDIMVQDVENKIYLIASNGKIIWQKQLDNAILGEVEQIDIYKNSRLQMAFATKNKVYVLDRNGKNVGPFPLKFKDDITQPLSVFDYDKRKNYRFLVTQNKSILMYNAKAKRVNGFKFEKAKNTINSQPKHFRINSKDYIVFSQGNKLEILNRQGQKRVSVNTDIQFTHNAIYLYRNRFTTLSKNSIFTQVDTKGKVSNKKINVSENSNLAMTSKTMVTLSENKLKIKSKTVDLDFGDYTAPKIFYLQDKIYVTTTDLQAKKVYVYDSQAKLLPNFPVFGSSSATLQNIDNKTGLELITQSDTKTIIVYKIN